MEEKKSLQETYAPANACFGCGPANPKGLHIRSFVEGEEAVAELCFYAIGLGGLLLVLAVGGGCSLFLCLPLHVCNVLRMVRCINWSFLKPARVFQT